MFHSDTLVTDFMIPYTPTFSAKKVVSMSL